MKKWQVPCVPLAHVTPRDTALTPRKFSVVCENCTRGPDCPRAAAERASISRQRMHELSQNLGAERSPVPWICRLGRAYNLAQRFPVSLIGDGVTTIICSPTS